MNLLLLLAIVGVVYAAYETQDSGYEAAETGGGDPYPPISSNGGDQGAYNSDGVADAPRGPAPRTNVKSHSNVGNGHRAGGNVRTGGPGPTANVNGHTNSGSGPRAGGNVQTGGKSTHTGGKASTGPTGVTSLGTRVTGVQAPRDFTYPGWPLQPNPTDSENGPDSTDSDSSAPAPPAPRPYPQPGHYATTGQQYPPTQGDASTCGNEGSNPSPPGGSYPTGPSRPSNPPAARPSPNPSPRPAPRPAPRPSPSRPSPPSNPSPRPSPSPSTGYVTGPAGNNYNPKPSPPRNPPSGSGTGTGSVPSGYEGAPTGNYPPVSATDDDQLGYDEDSKKKRKMRFRRRRF